MNKAQAVVVKEKALVAVQSLVSILDQLQGELPAEEFDRIKRSVGLAVGEIEMQINVPIYQMFPELET